MPHLRGERKTFTMMPPSGHKITRDDTFCRKDDTEQVKTYTVVADPNERLVNLLGPAFADYRRRFEAATRFEELPLYPIHIDLEISYGCNLRCPMCNFGIETSKRRREPAKGRRLLPMELIRSIVHDGIPLGLSSIGLSFYNEPLLREDIIDICRWAMGAGILDIHLVTNGTLLTEYMSRKILEAQIPRLSFSIDAATRETYEKIRPGADYDAVHHNIDRFIAMKSSGGFSLPLIRVSFVRTSINEKEEHAFIDKWKNRADYYAIQEYVNCTPEQNYLVPSNRVQASAFKCPQSWQRLIVRSDGSVLPCTSPFQMENPIGNIRESGIQHIWLSDGMNNLRKIHKEGHFFKNPACLECARNSVI